MRENNWFREHGLILLTGIVVGIAALVLTASGNPKNMGFCIACFERDIAGALVFLGCPLRMVIRLGGGDLTAVAGLVGFVAGILVGIVFLRKGFSLGRAYPVRQGEGLMLPDRKSVV